MKAGLLFWSSRLLVAPDVLCSEWKQGKVPGALDGSSQSALVFGASPCLATRLDLSPLSEKPS